jgi:hypothetical protein
MFAAIETATLCKRSRKNLGPINCKLMVSREKPLMNLNKHLIKKEIK